MHEAQLNEGKERWLMMAEFDNEELAVDKGCPETEQEVPPDHQC